MSSFFLKQSILNGRVYNLRPGGEAVTHRSAKPTFTGSNPVLVSFFKNPPHGGFLKNETRKNCVCTQFIGVRTAE